LVGFALYGAFYHRVTASLKFDSSDISFDNPLIFTSLLFGSMIPYVFSALTMKSVGKAALGMI
jgi:Na+/H+-translocating membrane pyrophosphatase